MQSKLVPYEMIEKAVGGDTASLLAIQQHYKPYIAYLSHSAYRFKRGSQFQTVRSHFAVQARLSATEQAAMAVKRVKAVNRFRPLKIMGVSACVCHQIGGYKSTVYAVWIRLI